MLFFRGQSTERDEKLPIEHPLRESLGIYFDRLKVFFLTVVANILILALFIGFQRLSINFAYWLNVNVIGTILFTLTIMALMFSLVYQRTNPAKGYLIFSDKEKELFRISLYTGWRYFKTDFRNYAPFWNRNFFLIAGNTKYLTERDLDGNLVDRKLRAHILFKARRRNLVLFNGNITEGETVVLSDGILVSYRSSLG